MGIDQTFAKALAKHNAGKHHEAISLYKMILLKNPMHLDAMYLLGTAYAEIGKLDEAKRYLLKAEKIMPTSPYVKVNLGNIYKELGDYETASIFLRQALDLHPELPHAHCNLGSTLCKLGRFEEAETCCRRALAIDPNVAEAHSNLGDILKGLGRLEEAEACCHQALKINPNLAVAHCKLGDILQALGRLEEAEACYRHALEIRPDYPDAQGTLLFSLNYTARHNHSDDLEEARKYGQMVTKKATTRFSTWHCLLEPKSLRVGLISGDLINHPVGYFVENMLASIDPSRIELLAYSTKKKEDDLTSRIKPYFSSWKTLVGISDAAAAELIHADGVHLLLDLSGHTSDNRLPIFAWKPAPVQTSWLGYFATTGVAEMDYLLGDPYVTPAEEFGHFTESVWLLPETYLCFTQPNFSLEYGVLPAMNASGVTFGSFNNLTKMNDSVVRLWARVLQAVPSSRLFLKTRQLSDPGLCAATRQRFAALGIDPDRLILEGSSPRIELLKAYNRVDIALDPFPYPGGTTSAEAMWMGVPVLTKRGDRFLSHIGESIAHNAGLVDWIADNDDDYVAKAVGHATDLEKLAILRQNLRHQVQASPLFDAPRFARHFEAALWGMWERWRSHGITENRTVTMEADNV